jgi:predicted nucleic acid-binding protein
LDTTYLLSAIGVSVKGLAGDAMMRLIEKGHEISISDITVFELSAIGAKHTVLGSLSAERVSRGIRAIVHDERIERIPVHDSSVLLTAFRLRRSLNDFIDCLILSSAINRCDLLSTEDRDIQDLEEKGFHEIIQALNPDFKIRIIADVI